MYSVIAYAKLTETQKCTSTDERNFEKDRHATRNIEK
jgi:hypothetical protein